MQWKRPRYNRKGTIDCDLEHPRYGEIPFTASPDDQAPEGPAVYQDIMASGEPIDPAPGTTKEEQVAALQQARDAEIEAITVKTASGKVFKGSTPEQNRMHNTLDGMTLLSAPVQWILANGSTATIAYSELQSAANKATARENEIRLSYRDKIAAVK